MTNYFNYQEMKGPNVIRNPCGQQIGRDYGPASVFKRKVAKRSCGVAGEAADVWGLRSDPRPASGSRAPGG